MLHPRSSSSLRAAMLGLLALALVGAVTFAPAAVAASAGAGVPDPAQAPADPSVAGPFGVGVTKRTLERASSSTGEPRPLELVIWYPSTVARDAAVDPVLWGAPDAEPARRERPFPVVVWSHGAESEPWSSTFVTTHLASHGFVVVAPPHAGTRTGDCPDPCDVERYVETARAREAIANRPDEVVAAREHVVTLGGAGDPILGGLVDGERSGVAGHSIGAATALVAAAQDGRFRALVAMATVPADQLIIRRAAGRVRVPTMLLGGGRDHLTPPLEQRGLYGALGEAVKERWLVLMPRAGHLAFQDVCPPSVPGCGPDDLPRERAFREVVRWTTAFALRHVAGDERYGPLLDPVRAEGADAEVSFGTGA